MPTRSAALAERGVRAHKAGQKAPNHQARRPTVAGPVSAERPAPMCIPRHIGFIPDGNRRWAQERGLGKAEGYAAGIAPGLALLDECIMLGIREASVYGFTQDNTLRPKEQSDAFRAACVEFARQAVSLGVSLLALGDSGSPLFPPELIPYSTRQGPPDGMRLNLLVNYGWEWDLRAALETQDQRGRADFRARIASAEVSRIDLIVRWGGRRRLSGFLPVQSVYADVFVEDAYWPDYRPEHLYSALAWYSQQDITLGG